MISPSKGSDKGGKKAGTKYKSLLVWNILLKKTDEDHALGIKDIQQYLECYGVAAERHSIKRDIDDILSLVNKEYDFDLYEMGMEERDLLNYEIEYDPSLHGYKVSRRPYEFEELRLLAESVRASKFISKSQEENLIVAIENLCSEHQIDELHSEVYAVGRNKTASRNVMVNMLMINQAIRSNKQISFYYQKYTLNDLEKPVDRRKGSAYVLSPFKLIISEGNYYLVGWDSKPSRIVTYRLDRMRKVSLLEETREGMEELVKIDLDAYTRQHFNMYRGPIKRVTIQFVEPLLDAFIDRFGNGRDVFYRRVDDSHLSITAPIAVSDQFFGWISGFRKKATITSPAEVVEDFQKFIEDIASKYQRE